MADALGQPWGHGHAAVPLPDGGAEPQSCSPEAAAAPRPSEVVQELDPDVPPVLISCYFQPAFHPAGWVAFSFQPPTPFRDRLARCCAHPAPVLAPGTGRRAKMDWEKPVPTPLLQAQCHGAEVRLQPKSLHHPGYGDRDVATTREGHISVLLFQGFFLFYSYQLSSPSSCAAPKPPSSDHEHPTGELTHRVRAEPASHTSHPGILLTAQTLTMNDPLIPSWLSHSQCQHRYCCRQISRSTPCHAAAAAAPWGSGNRSSGATAKPLSHATNAVRCRQVLFIFFSFESSFLNKMLEKFKLSQELCGWEKVGHL